LWFAAILGDLRAGSDFPACSFLLPFFAMCGLLLLYRRFIAPNVVHAFGQVNAPLTAEGTVPLAW
jgi:hypothetical protein